MYTFEFQLESDSSVVTKIKVIGPFVTFYVNKPDNSAEFEKIQAAFAGIAKAMKLDMLLGNAGILHDFAHGAMSSHLDGILSLGAAAAGQEVEGHFHFIAERNIFNVEALTDFMRQFNEGGDSDDKLMTPDDITGMAMQFNNQIANPGLSRCLYFLSADHYFHYAVAGIVTDADVAGDSDACIPGIAQVLRTARTDDDPDDDAGAMFVTCQRGDTSRMGHITRTDYTRLIQRANLAKEIHDDLQELLAGDPDRQHEVIARLRSAIEKARIVVGDASINIIPGNYAEEARRFILHLNFNDLLWEVSNCVDQYMARLTPAAAEPHGITVSDLGGYAADDDAHTEGDFAAVVDGGTQQLSAAAAAAARVTTVVRRPSRLQTMLGRFQRGLFGERSRSGHDASAAAAAPPSPDSSSDSDGDAQEMTAIR